MIILDSSAASVPSIQETTKQVSEFQKYLTSDLLPRVGNFFFKVGVSLLVYFIAAKIINKVTRMIATRILHSKAKVDQTATVFLSNTLKVVLKVLVAIGLLGYMGVTNATIVAAFGSITVGLGLAMQGGMANFAGGVLITFLKPFEIGDYIIEVGEKNEGTVTKIDMFYTTLRTADDHMVTIPNQLLTNSSVINLTKAGTRRISIKVGISYDADIKTAKALITGVLDKEERILKDRDRKVVVSELGDSAITLNVLAFTKTEDYFPVFWHLNEAIKTTLDEGGISIPYPQMDVHMTKEEK